MTTMETTPDRLTPKDEIIAAMRTVILENQGKALGAIIESAGQSWFVDETIRLLRDRRADDLDDDHHNAIDHLAVECAVECEITAMSALMQRNLTIDVMQKKMRRAERVAVSVGISTAINAIAYEIVFLAILAVIISSLFTFSIQILASSGDDILRMLVMTVPQDKCNAIDHQNKADSHSGDHPDRQ